jgi:dipeptidase E
MKLLLTSFGIANESMKKSLHSMLGKDFSEAKLVLIPTASVAENSEHSWFVKEMNQVFNMGWKEFHIVPLNGLPKSVIVERLKTADVIYTTGGSVYHLARSISINGLTEDFAKLLEEKVYVGSSAGSMIFSRHLNRRSADLFDETKDLTILGTETIASPFNYFDWYIKPHLYSEEFPERTDPWIEKKASEVDFKIYAIDDQTAVQVIDGKVDFVTEGKWREFN